MFVVKKNGKKQELDLSKLTLRVKNLSKNLKIDPNRVSTQCANGLYDGISTTQVDELLASTAEGLAPILHSDYSILAGRILASRVHKITPGFYEGSKILYSKGLLSKEYFSLVKKFGKELEKKIDYDRDMEFDSFAMRTLIGNYLKKYQVEEEVAGPPNMVTQKKEVLVERPQDVLMRVSLALWGDIESDNVDRVLKTYEQLSSKHRIFGTPNLQNAGTKRQQMSSCFLMQIKDDSIAGIYDSLKDAALISQSAGGLGFHGHNLRASGSIIKSTQGATTGLVPVAKVYNHTQSYVDQGGKRKGAFALYLEPWHADFVDVLNTKSSTTHEDKRCNHLFLAIWANDLFLERAEKGLDWSFFCPSDTPDLPDLYGKDFNKRYEEYEKMGYARKTMKARDLFEIIVKATFSATPPYFLFKDSANIKSNQKNLGTIKSSNLCVEIMQYSSPEEVAVCNLASIALPRFVKPNREIDYSKLEEVVQDAIEDLDRVIDLNYYPIQEARNSNFKHRPVGLGVQGLADMFMKMRLPFDSEGARKVNKEVFEAMYYYALKSSVRLAKEKGAYSTFKGSPASEGVLQFDLWGVTPSDRFDWNQLKEEIKKYGLRNSLLIALMPTATTSQILGNYEAFYPVNSNLFSREVGKGQFVVINRYLIEEIEKLGMDVPTFLSDLATHKGSVQAMENIPQEIKDIYKTVWEISVKTTIDLSADRGPFICQSQSMNLFFKEPNAGRFSQAIYHAWSRGLKTGCYYLKQPNNNTSADIARSAQSTSTLTKPQITEEKIKEQLTCSLDNREGCDACGA